MQKYDITKPIGFETLCKEIDSTCSNAYIYSRCGLRPNHYIIPLDSGAGRTTIIEYMTAKYKATGVLGFLSGPDDYIEISFDGTLQQLKQAFAAISSAAVYTNMYCNIISMDISSLADHLGELQISEFMKNCKKVCEYACVVFFIHTIPTRNEEKLLEKLSETIDNIKRMKIEPYNKEDICALIIKTIEGHGVMIQNKSIFCSILKDVVTELSITSVKEAVTVAKKFVNYADFSGFIPTINEESLKLVITDGHINTKRSKLK